MFWLELIVVLGMLLVGARVGGIFLGMSSGVSLAVLIFGFCCTPGQPPIDVVMIIMAVVVTQASGGMDYLIQVAIRMLRSNPKRISIYAPLISWLFTFMCGTGYIAYGILPVIAEVSREAGVRPERPISISVIASQQAITACPISAATVALLGFLAPANISLIDILLVCVPATLIGVLAGALYASRMGAELAEDPAYLARVAAGDAAPIHEKTDFQEKTFGHREKQPLCSISLRPSWSLPSASSLSCDGTSVGLCARPLLPLLADSQSGRHARGTRAARTITRHLCTDDDRHLSRGQRTLFHPQLRHRPRRYRL